MKLKSLFLATLAAMAMASCSNDNDPITDNGDQVEKNASLLFSIGVPAGTRAETTEVGLSAENGFTTVEVKIAYNNGSASQYTFGYDDFSYENNTYTLKDENKMLVAEGDATIYVTLNNGKSVDETETKTVTYDESGSISTGIVGENKFLMSGSTTKSIEREKVNIATVEVSRVVAKIAEQSDATMDGFTFTTTHKKNGTTVSTEQVSMKAIIQDYALVNLNQTTNVFSGRTAPQASLFQPVTLDGNNSNTEIYTNADGTPYLTKREIGDGKDKDNATISSFTYCAENGSDNATSIIYRVKYTDNEGEINTFFTKGEGDNLVLYKDFDTMDKDNNYTLSGAGLSATSTYDEFIKVGVKKYENGVAYYVKEIKTAGAASIVRNNVYKLSVKSIGGIGRAVIDEREEGKPTYLILNVTIAPWTINLNEFVLGGE